MAEQQPPVSAPDSTTTPTPDSAAGEAPSQTAAPSGAVATVDPPAAPEAPAQTDAVAPAAPADNADNTDLAGVDQAAIDELLKQASFEDPSAVASAAGASASMPDTSDLKLPDFQQVMQDAEVSSIDLLRDVELDVKIELGRSHMLVEDVLKLAEGSVVELDKLAGDPVDVFVNDRLVARGEVLVLNDTFCVRINEIVAGVKEEGL
jgi:flagellar motor switch protein FliN/FliY